MDKRWQWLMIQERALDVAVLLSKLKVQFGRPSGVVILLSSGEFVESGNVSRIKGVVGEA